MNSILIVYFKRTPSMCTVVTSSIYHVKFESLALALGFGFRFDFRCQGYSSVLHLTILRETY